MDAAVVLAIAAALLAGTLALTVAWFEKNSIAFWSLAAGLGLLGFECVFNALTAAAPAALEMVYWQNWRLLAASLLPPAWLLFSVTYASAAHPAWMRRWRTPVLLALFIPAALAIGFHSALVKSSHHDPAGSRWMLDLSTAGRFMCGWLLVSAVGVLANLERTFRAAAGTIRWRIKFMLLGVGLLFAVRVYSTSQELLFHATSLPFQALNTDALLVSCLLMIGTLFRTGQLEIKVYPSRLLLHNSVTLFVSGIYLLVMLGLVRVIPWLERGQVVALRMLLILVGLALLSLVLLSDRARSLMRLLISRHFQRPQYDYRAVWTAFTEGTARHVELPELCNAVVKLISELFQANSVTAWLLDERKENLVFGASTSLSATAAPQHRFEAGEAADLSADLGCEPKPFSLPETKARWAPLFMTLDPEKLARNGGTLCAPMMARGELVGFLIVGGRVDGQPFSAQDCDLLKSASDQAAASVLNIQLSQQLSQAKQLEAFQTMSTFFVHDLKNTASTLSLMLRNLPLHFDKPEFRQDALRGISKTVTHINHLITRLSLLRQDLAQGSVESDLNQLVTQTLSELHEAPDTELVQDLRPVPKVRVDPAQMRHVVTNLVLNAREAAGPAGKIKVETSESDGWVTLAVQDNGCGMSSDFVRRSLFRPFKTTKKNGIGIGMFQCKMIVEAHRGQIQVESAPGKGTAFRVLLPAWQAQAA
jgi:putative PEP-CTERM system histidine kinase